MPIKNVRVLTLLSILQTLLIIVGLLQVQSSVPFTYYSGAFNIIVNPVAMLLNIRWLPTPIQRLICVELAVCVALGMLLI